MEMPIITNKGLALLTKVSNNTLNLSYIALGSGENLIEESIESLKNEEIRTKVEYVQYKGTKMEVRATFSNEDIEKGFYVTEIGLYAIDPNEGEILYAYTCVKGADADYFTPKSNSLSVNEVIQIIIGYGNASKVNLIVDNKLVYMTAEDYGIISKRVEAVDSQLQQIENKKVNKDEVTNGMTPAGNIAYASLPTSGNTVGDYYYCPDGDGTNPAGNYAWNGLKWYFAGTGDEGYNELKKTLSDVKVDIKNVSDYDLSSILFNRENGVYNIYGEINDGGTFYHTIIEVSKGETYLIAGHNYNINYPAYICSNEDLTRAYSYYSSSENLDTGLLEVTIPDGATKLCINFNSVYACSVIKKALKPTSDIIYKDTYDFYEVQCDILIGQYNYLGVRNESETGYCTSVDVVPGDELRINGFNLSNTYRCGFVHAYDGTNIMAIGGTEYNKQIYNLEITIPIYASKVYINSQLKEVLKIEKKKSLPTIEDFYIKKSNNMSHKKKIVWFGPSIPNGQYAGVGTSYPEIVGKKLNAIVYNESVASSGVHCRAKSRIDASLNPYGFQNNFKSAALCLGGSLDEKEWLIQNYNSSIFTDGKYTELSNADKEYFKNCSYERKLDKYLTKEAFPDLFVFDHGRNDMWSSSDWTLDANEPYNEYSYQARMNFLIKRILNFNDHARIVIIGHYTNQERNSSDTVVDFPTKIADGQMEVAEYWQLPLLKLWNKTGWSNKSINNKSMLGNWLPDKLHPHSDTTGRAINHLANIITPFVKDSF